MITADNRMFDFKAFYDKMVLELPDNSVIAEVGVADGASALYLAKEMYNAGKRFKLYMIDNLDYGKNEQLSTLIKNVMESGLQGSIEIMPLDSLNASCKFNDNFFDFIFLDSSHTYEQTKAECRLWYRKVKDGGVLGGHDYTYLEEVRNAVNEVLPFEITREPIIEQEQFFEPEKFLNIEKTRDEYGVYWVRKDFYKKIL